jgi:hypothetical protein
MVLTWCLVEGVSHAALCPKKDLWCRMSLPFPVPCLGLPLKKKSSTPADLVTSCCLLAAETFRTS